MLEPRALQNHSDIVQFSAFCGNDRTGVCFVKTSMLIYGQANCRGPLDQRVVGVEMKKVTVLTGRRDAQDVLERLCASLVLCGKRFNLLLLLGRHTQPEGFYRILLI